MASIVPLARRQPKSSRTSSAASRRETRFLTARVATAACRRGPKAPRGTSAGSFSARLGGALRAAQPVQAVLAHRERDLWQLRDLVALRRSRVPALVRAEGARACLAALGPVVDYLVHQLEGKEPAILALVSGLPAGTATRERGARARRRRDQLVEAHQQGDRGLPLAVENGLRLGTIHGA